MAKLNNKHQQIKVMAVLIFSLLVLAITPFLGLKMYSPMDVLKLSSNLIDSQIFWAMRVPRVLFAFLAGAGLALCGMIFQSLFRNALATPYTLGIASGASLGAAISVAMGSSWAVFGIGSQTFAAFAGALLAIGIVYAIARLKSGFSVATLLLAGVAINFFFSSIILFVQYLGKFTDSIRIMRWLMGGLEVVGFDKIWILLPITLVTILVVFMLTRELNLLSLGEAIASSRGVALDKLKLGLFVLTSLQVGAIVSLCGPIGFVGMMAPHISRLIVGQDHRWLSITSLLFGGSFLVICDTLARWIIAPAEMPVGIITAFLGGPFFLWLLFSGRQRLSGGV